jgi:hypothetical protein
MKMLNVANGGGLLSCGEMKDKQIMMNWKPNWAETKQHFCDWWAHRGLVLAGGAFPAATPHEVVPAPGQPPTGPDDHSYYHKHPEWRAQVNHYLLAKTDYLADTLPLAHADIGPGSLALLLGSEPGFSPTTVWFEPTMMNDEAPETRPPLRFDPENFWLRMHLETARSCAAMGRGKYAVGCPDLVENVDIIAALREPQVLLLDLIERPEWVEQKVREINQVWFEAYSRVYDLIKLDDGSACWGAFGLWGPGKTAKLQCDASSMFSPDMFERFVVPALTEQCEWLDYSMFHLDGHQCLCHLDHLLAIEPLDAIEWTPDPKVAGGGSPEWYPLYRRILAAGKSVQAIHVELDEVIPLLDAVGGNGMHISVNSRGDRKVFENLNAKLGQYRCVSPQKG